MKKRVLTGYRTTGRAHIGQYHGNLENMLKLQDEYDCFFFLADWHALTTEYKETENLKEYINEMIIDWLAAGIDPEKCTIYRQSDLPEVAELTLYLGMITPLAWLERCTTYKEQLHQLAHKEITNYGFLGYPVLMAADILIVLAEIVPVGEDQVAHLELTREIVRRFNFLYGKLFPEPQPLLSKSERILGIDGRKMSKSYNNAIYISDSQDEMREKVRMMITDPERIYLKDPGHPDICLVFSLQQIYSADKIDEIRENCEKARVGCTECKKNLAETMNEFFKDFRERRKKIEKNPAYVKEVLEEGRKRVKPIASATLEKAREKIKI